MSAAPAAPAAGRVAVVVVAFGQADMVLGCIRSVQLHGGSTVASIHVVDNGSPDDTAARVAHDHPEVDLHLRPDNPGFSVANNVVLRTVRDEYVLLLNPDAELAAGTLQHLVRVLDESPDIGVIGCRLVLADGSLDHAAKRNVPEPLTALRYFMLRAVGRRGSGYVAPDVEPDGLGDVDAVNGAFMLVRRSAMDQVGLLDEAFWMYGEDLDWCVRFRSAGWRVVYDGRVTALHLKGGAVGGARPLRLNFHFHRSMAMFYAKHQSNGNLVADAVIRTGIWTRFLLVWASNAAGALVRRLTRSAS